MVLSEQGKFLGSVSGGCIEEELISRVRSAFPATFAALAARADAPRSAAEIETNEIIERDLARTYPRHRLFCRSNERGAASLRKVLRAYAAHDRGCGYCQGMAFIAAVLLMYTDDDEDAFWLLSSCMSNRVCNLRVLFLPGMVAAKRCFFVFDRLLARFAPRLAKHLDRCGIVSPMFVTNWYLTVFSASFPFELVVRVWDMFFTEGWKPVHRVACALLMVDEKKYLAMDFEGIMMSFRTLPEQVDVHSVLDVALAIPMTNSMIDGLTKEFDRNEGAQ